MWLIGLRQIEKCIISKDVYIDESVLIGSRCKIQNSVSIYKGVTIEDDVFIGAGTLVPPNKRLESGYLYVGNPMVKKRPLKEAEMAFLKQSAINYVELKNDYLAEGA